MAFLATNTKALIQEKMHVPFSVCASIPLTSTANTFPATFPNKA